MLENVKTLIEKEKIKQRIDEIANQISKDYNGEDITIICLLKGAAYFALDLSKKIYFF